MEPLVDLCYLLGVSALPRPLEIREQVDRELSVLEHKGDGANARDVVLAASPTRRPRAPVLSSNGVERLVSARERRCLQIDRQRRWR